jgi:hypothetical protein
MGSDLPIRYVAELPQKGLRERSRPYRPVSAFEIEIRQMYAQMLDEPVPPRLLGILRAALAAKS